jgi:hypothetical protein
MLMVILIDRIKNRVLSARVFSRSNAFSFVKTHEFELNVHSEIGSAFQPSPARAARDRILLLPARSFDFGEYAFAQDF